VAGNRRRAERPGSRIVSSPAQELRTRGAALHYRRAGPRATRRRPRFGTARLMYARSTPCRWLYEIGYQTNWNGREWRRRLHEVVPPYRAEFRLSSTTSAIMVMTEDYDCTIIYKEGYHGRSRDAVRRRARWCCDGTMHTRTSHLPCSYPRLSPCPRLTRQEIDAPISL
jgi:hypothetical protein